MLECCQYLYILDSVERVSMIISDKIGLTLQIWLNIGLCVYASVDSQFLS